MLKGLFLAVFSILYFATASWNLYAKSYITHSDFVKLTTEKKNQHVVKIMQLMVDLEAQYKRDVRSGNTTSEYFRYYSLILFKIQSLLIADAHAAPGDWAEVASSVRNYINSAGPNSVCIFGGWPSKMNGSMCGHPKSTQRNGYLRGACKSNEVSCNPVIFGYKKESLKTIFCASIANNAENSSLSCMQQALADPQAADADPVALRLEKLRANLSANPAVASEIFKFAYQTCVCDSSPAAMVVSYQDRIRPHKTCYGLMNMMADATATGCSADFNATINIDIFTKLKAHITQNAIDSSDSNAYTSSYQNFLTTLRRDNQADLTAMCPSDGRVPAVTVTRDETPDPIPEPEPETEIIVTGTKCVATCTPPATEGGDPVCTSFKRGEVTITPDAGSTPRIERVTNAAGVETRVVRLSHTPAAEADAAPDNAPPEKRDVDCEIPDMPPTPAPVDSKKLILELEVTDTRTQTKITTMVKDEKGTEVTDAKIEWTKKEIASDDDEETEDRSDRFGVTDSTETTVTETTDTSGKKIGTGKDKTVSRETEEFEVCAIAKKEGYTDSNEECVAIEPLDAKDAVVGPQMPPGGGQPGGTGGVIRNLGIR